MKNILRKCFSSGADANFMVYEWRNVPRTDGYSPSQLMFGRNQRTCLPSLPLQNPPIDFQQAAVSKESLHTRSKIDHDRSKLLVSAFTYKIQNLLLGTCKALLFPCIPTSSHISLTWTTGPSLVLAIFYAPSSLKILLLLPLSRLRFHLPYYVVRSDFNLVPALLQITRQFFFRLYLLPHLYHHVRIWPENH